jgi:hypothetical protein
MKISLVLAAGLLAAMVSPAWGQEQKPVPIPPYLAPVPATGHWTLHLSRSAASASGTPVPAPVAAGEPDSIEMVKGRSLLFATLTFSGGNVVHLDREGDSYFRRTTAGLELLGGFPSPYVLDGFLFAGWVRTEGTAAFQGVVKYRGATCFYYRNGKGEPAQWDPRYGQEAWIDVLTMLPIAAKSDGLEVDFQFHDAPSSPLQLPVDEARLVKNREEAVRVMNTIR